MTIYFAPEAGEDFAAVVGYLVERNPTAAAAVGKRIFATIDKLARGDFEGAELALATGEIVRSWPVPPVRIYYQRHGNALWVVRIYHHARSPIVR